MAAQGQANGRLAREIAHHERIAARAEAVWNWDSPAGRRRAERRGRLLVEAGGLGPGVRGLELGCGTGVFLERVARSGATLRGLDLSMDLLALARARVGGQPNAGLDRGNAEQLPYADGCFDVVYGSSVLHHLELEPCLREVMRVLRTGGRIAFAEPNVLNPQVAFMFHCAPLKPYFGVSPDEKAFSRFRIRGVLQRLGFAAIKVRPFDFLHPSVPGSLVGAVERLGLLVERVPALCELAGSLLITAHKA